MLQGDLWKLPQNSGLYHYYCHSKHIHHDAWSPFPISIVLKLCLPTQLTLPHPDRDHLHIVTSRTKSPFAASQRLIILQMRILSQLSCDMYCIVFPSLSPSTWATLCQYSWADFRIGPCHQINLLCCPPLRFTWLHIGSWLSSTVCLILSFDICVCM